MADYFVHESSYVDEGAEIGVGTKIWHFSHIMPKARIGSHCSIGQNVNIGSRAVIGNGVKIQNNVSVYDDVILEDDVFCGPSCVFTNVINPRAFVERKTEYKLTRVKRGASIGANATVVFGGYPGGILFRGGWLGGDPGYPPLCAGIRQSGETERLDLPLRRDSSHKPGMPLLPYPIS
jgi:UDP-2-acetamido-3-amino-2,3-dideoxy-glucuronate N-acetyltransferase